MFSIFGLLLLLYNSLGQHQGVEKALRKLKESVDRFEFNFHKAVLEEYGQIGMVKSVRGFLKGIFKKKKLKKGIGGTCRKAF